MPRRNGKSAGRFQQNTKLMRQNATSGRFQAYSSAGKQLFQDVMYLKSLINSELHFADGNNSFTPPPSGVVQHITAIAQGDLRSERSGDYVLPRYVEFRLQITVNAVTANQRMSTIRFIAFRWNSPTTPTAASILSITSPLSPYTAATQGAHGDTGVFDILCDKVYTVSPQWQMIQSPVIDCELSNPQRPSQHVHFDGSSTTAPIGGLYYLLVSSDVTSSSDVSVVHRLHWYDN
jgi:hypothetical protein